MVKRQTNIKKKGWALNCYSPLLSLQTVEEKFDLVFFNLLCCAMTVVLLSARAMARNLAEL